MAIVEKQLVLKPSTMATVAERRFGDAKALSKTGQNPRANGVVYLAGLVIEILLKARLVDAFPVTAKKRSHEVREEEREIWSLIWRRHELEEMLNQMPALEAALKKRGERASVNYLADLRKVCAGWTIHVRYSSQKIQMSEAQAFLDRVRALKEVLK